MIFTRDMAIALAIVTVRSTGNKDKRRMYLQNMLNNMSPQELMIFPSVMSMAAQEGIERDQYGAMQ